MKIWNDNLYSLPYYNLNLYGFYGVFHARTKRNKKGKYNMEKVIGFILLIIANGVLSHCGITLATWEWWVVMVCMVGWSVLNNG